MERDRRRQLVLAALVVVLAGVVLYQYRNWSSTSAAPAPSSNPRGGNVARASQRSEPAVATAPEVHLEALGAERPTPHTSERNLFRFKARALPPPPPPPASRVPRPVEPVVPVVTGPPPPPPITLKFIGILEPDGAKKIAILSDGRGSPFFGREGETVLGQYRVLRIGVESVEMSYLDGRGRQTIRLSGS